MVRTGPIQAWVGDHSELWCSNLPGGNVEAAISFGQDIIEYNQLNTGVAAGGTCASACAILWASGKRRSVAPDSRIGVHQVSLGGRSAEFFTEDADAMSMTAFETGRASLYLRTRGASESVWLNGVTGAQPDQIHWLPPSEIAEWKTVALTERPHFSPPHHIEPTPSNQPQGGWITIPDERADTFDNCFRVAQQQGMDIGVAENICIGLGITKFHWTKEYMIEECVRIAMPLTQWPDELVRPGCERRYAVNYAKYGRR